MSERGLVVARFRRHALVEDAAGEIQDCRLQGHRLRPVVGDNVDWRRESDGSGTVEKVRPRDSMLQRQDSRGRPEVIAANLSQLIVVLAPQPAPDWFLLDRYLCAAELAGLRGVILYNKIDLVRSEDPTLAIYRDIGYPVASVSARNKTGLAVVERWLADGRAALTGQSGVGKSALFNALLGDDLQKTGSLSRKIRQGRHTTSTAVLHRHSGGGELIDSPGVRNYDPCIEDCGDVQRGFREFIERRELCRFDDCSHRAEPDCAIKSALNNGSIDAQRYENYLRLHEFTESARAF